MSSGQTIISLDALGADKAPGVCLNGAKLALSKDPSLTIELVGPKEVVEPFANENDRVVPVVATQQIDMGEHPAMAVRKKKDSSIVIGCKRVKDGHSHGFFSGGNTGACLSAATLNIGRIKGIKRPMLATMLPTVTAKATLFCDVGANADCKPEYLLQFGQMAKAYLQKIENNNSPKIALLNIGEEDTKGSKLALDANELLHKKLDSFVGNAEGRDLLTGEFDAIITDGFNGNVALKTMEGTIKALMSIIKDCAMSSTKSKLGALMLKPALKSKFAELNPDKFGGAVLLGVNGACVVGHGSSNEDAICNGILYTAQIARSNVVEAIRKHAAEM